MLKINQKFSKIAIITITLVLIMCSIMGVLLIKDTTFSVYATETSSAKGMCVVEKNSKKVFYEKNKDAKLANASTTKIVTAITVIQNCDDLDEVITVNDLAIGIEGTSIYLRKGEQISVRDLLYGLMLRSGNDSACALAYHVGGTMENFVAMMNETCEKAGAQNSHFANPHGLDQEGHYTTAYDLALITAYALNNPIFKEIVSTKQHTIQETNMSETRYLANKNKLLRNLDGCIGVKTGFTSNAGRCLVSAVERDGMTLICVVLYCGPMFEESATLLNAGFRDYTYACVVNKDEPIYNEYYLNDTKGQLNLKAEESYYLPINKYSDDKIVIKYNVYGNSGTINEGEEVGELQVFINNHLQKTIKLYTINKIDVLNAEDALNSIKLQWEENYEIK